MGKPNLLVICRPDHYVLRNLEPLRDVANITVSNDPAVLSQKIGDAEIVLYSGIVGQSRSLKDVWDHAGKVKWVHSLSAGVEPLLFPKLVESSVVVTNARGVFKRSLAEF